MMKFCILYPCEAGTFCAKIGAFRLQNRRKIRFVPGLETTGRFPVSCAKLLVSIKLFAIGAVQENRKQEFANTLAVNNS